MSEHAAEKVAESRVVGGYCPACRESFGTQENPPYSVIHRDGEHLHPITRARVDSPVDERGPASCVKCGEVCFYDGWGHVHESGVGIGSCEGSQA